MYLHKSNSIPITDVSFSCPISSLPPQRPTFMPIQLFRKYVSAHINNLKSKEGVFMRV